MAFTAQKFAYRHPTFGRSKVAKSSEPYKNSAYYLWWEFLRRNDGYKKCCENGGKGQYSKLYQDFGNVHQTNFKTWWQTNNRGATLFGEIVPPEFKVIDNITNCQKYERTIYLQVSLDLPKRFLTSQFNKILDKHHSGSRGRRTNKNSTARYPIIGHVDILALQKCLDVYDMKLNNPVMRQWEIGQKCKVTRPHQFIKAGDTEAEITSKKFVLTSTTNRLLKKARLIISKTVDGQFPVLK